MPGDAVGKDPGVADDGPQFLGELIEGQDLKAMIDAEAGFRRVFRFHSLKAAGQGAGLPRGSAFHLVPAPQSIKELALFSQKALGKSAQRLYYALTPQRADDPW